MAMATATKKGTTKKPKRATAKNGTVAVDYPEKEVQAYCMKCKEQVKVDSPKKTVVSGKNAVRGTCSVCETNVFKFTGGTVAGGKKAAAKKKAPASAEALKLSRKAKAAWNKLQKAGVLEDCWVGQLKSGVAIWWEGSVEEGWRLAMEDIAEDEMPEFKKLVLASL